ncbi:hypothetical protein AVEN_47864-1 [Araneus ventricosus]|uniref:Pre-C2HC domain-containing protein n=1 Tax=Araneus ventricosus TaxID=182803 RepID=A0A4Y2UND7_ARAVE|nr:hypothetical protein AVEN_47864-1 [Araneus ventricosus]
MDPIVIARQLNFQMLRNERNAPKNLHQLQKNRCLRNREKLKKSNFFQTLINPLLPKIMNLIWSFHPIQSQLPPQPKRKYVPPIIIDDPSNTAQLIKSFNELTDSKVEGKLLPNSRLKVFPTSADAHRTIQEELTKKNLKSHTFEMEGECQLRIVIRCLPEDYVSEDIIEYLKS